MAGPGNGRHWLGRPARWRSGGGGVQVAQLVTAGRTRALPHPQPLPKLAVSQALRRWRNVLMALMNG